MSIIPSEQESNLILEYILLPVVLTVFERDMIAVEQSSIKLKEPYLNLMQHSMNKVSRDLAKIRTELRKTNIKVYGEFKNSREVGCKYVYRGYHHSFSMSWITVKARVHERIKKYLGVK